MSWSPLWGRTFCTLCGRPCVREDLPAVDDEPAVLEDEIYRVAIANGRYIEVCLDHWVMWPDDHKVFPQEGFSQGSDEFDWVGWVREIAERTEGIIRTPGALAALENARRAGEEDPVLLLREALESWGR